MFDTPLDTLDADQTLTRVSELRVLADRYEVGVLETAAHWADLHGVVEARAGGGLLGCEQLVPFGGDGTPWVAEFCPAELGAELGLSVAAAESLIGDALDLRHRLPVLWARVRAGEVKPWIGRKVAQAIRPLDEAAAASVDAKASRWADRLTWGRLEGVVQAAMTAADPEQAVADAAERVTQRGVWISRTEQPDTATAFIRGDTLDLQRFDQALDRIADDRARLGDTSGHDARRAAGVGVLADAQATLDLLHPGASETTPRSGDHLPGERAPGRRRARPPATLYVHLTADALSGSTRDLVGDGHVARVEGVGPVTVDQARAWLGHDRVIVRPVLDISGVTPVDAYEIPDRLREAVRLMSPADTFPYGSRVARSMDIDHSVPYLSPDDGGPPGQTRIGNLAPLTRRPHRLKTHGDWRVEQPFPGVLVWRSPHGRFYLVDHTGTRRITQRGDAAAAAG